MPGVELSTLRREEIPLAAGVAARGLRDNPSSVALFGDDPVRRVRALEPMYQWILASMVGSTLVAQRQGIIVGIAALSPPHRCFFQQIVARERTLGVGRFRARVAVPSIPRNLLLPLLGLGPSALGRLSTWGEMGIMHDPAELHQHVELVVVEAALQGLGIGRMMMDALCRQMDVLPDVTYLETDKQENLRFYERFGFEVTGHETVLETDSWYMERRRAP